MKLSKEDRARLIEAGVKIVDGPVRRIQPLAEDRSAIVIAGDCHRFDSLYPALGSDTHTQLAEMLGARLERARLHRGRRASAHQRRRASTPRATSSSASTRSAMRWATAGSPRRPSATIWPRKRRSGARRGIRGRGRSARRRNPRFPDGTGSKSGGRQAFRFRAGRRRRNSRPRRPSRPERPPDRSRAAR